MKQPRKHHYLPQFYLRGFSVDDTHLFQIDKKTGKFIRGNIKDLATIRDFHIDDGDGGNDPHHVERELAKLESEHAKDLADLLQDGISNLAALGEVIGLLSMLRMRVPAVKDYVQSSLESQVRAKFDAMAKAGKFPPPPDGLEHLLDSRNIKFDILNWKCIQIMLNMAANKKNLSILAGMRATLYSAPAGHFFITCDQPVSLFLSSRNPKDLYGVGPNHPEAVVSLPLSSSKLLVLDNRDGPHREQAASLLELHEFNRRTTIMANNYLFCSENPGSFRVLLRRSKGIFAGFTYSDEFDEYGFVQLHRNIAIGPNGVPGRCWKY